MTQYDTSPSRIKWLMRRGMKELDIMANRYYSRHFETASEAEQQNFLKLLETVEDPDIWAWAMGYEETPAEFEEVIKTFRQA